MRTPLSERALNKTGPSPFRSQYYSSQKLVSTAVYTNVHLDRASTNNAVAKPQYECGFHSVRGNGAIYVLEGTTGA
jgi:hypothetical protein